MAKDTSNEYYLNPERTGFTFEERTGKPDSFSAGIGRVVLNFSNLESQLSSAVAKCLKLEDSLGRIVTSELPFRVKVHMVSSIVRHLIPEVSFNVGDDDPVSSWEELRKQCFRAEEMRNQVLHSEWSGPFLRDLKAERRKYTAKASRGLHIQRESVTDADLLDIADYIIQVAVNVEEFFLMENDSI